MVVRKVSKVVVHINGSSEGFEEVDDCLHACVGRCWYEFEALGKYRF